MKTEANPKPNCDSQVASGFPKAFVTKVSNADNAKTKTNVQVPVNKGIIFLNSHVAAKIINGERYATNDAGFVKSTSLSCDIPKTGETKNNNIVAISPNTNKGFFILFIFKLII